MSVSILGINIKKIREEKGLSAYKLAQVAGVGLATISDIENGKRQSLKSFTLEKIAGALSVTTDQLFLTEDGQSFIVMDIEQTVRTILSSEELTLDDIEMTVEEKKQVIDSVLKALNVIRSTRNK